MLDFWFDNLGPVDGDQVPGAKAVPFFLSSELSRDVLREVWSVIVGQAGTISRTSFYDAMRLIALLCTEEFAGWFPHQDMFTHAQGRDIPFPSMTGFPPPATSIPRVTATASQSGTPGTSVGTAAPEQEEDEDFGDFESHPSTPVRATDGYTSSGASFQSTSAPAPSSPAPTLASAPGGIYSNMMSNVTNTLTAQPVEQVTPMRELGHTGGTTCTDGQSVAVMLSPQMGGDASSRMSAFDDLVLEETITAVPQDDDWDDFTSPPPATEPVRASEPVEVGLALNCPDTSGGNERGDEEDGKSGSGETKGGTNTWNTDKEEVLTFDLEQESEQESEPPAADDNDNDKDNGMQGYVKQREQEPGLEPERDRDRCTDDFEDEFEDFQESPMPAERETGVAVSPADPFASLVSEKERRVEGCPVHVPSLGETDEQEQEQEQEQDKIKEESSDDVVKQEQALGPLESKSIAFSDMTPSQLSPSPTLTGMAVPGDTAEEEDWDEFKDFQAPLRSSAAGAIANPNPNPNPNPTPANADAKADAEASADAGPSPWQMMRLVARLVTRHKLEAAVLCVEAVLRATTEGTEGEARTPSFWTHVHDRELGTRTSLLNSEDSLEERLDRLAGLAQAADAAAYRERFASAEEAAARVTSVLGPLDADAEGGEGGDGEALELAVEVDEDLRAVAIAKRTVALVTALNSTHASLPGAWSKMLEALRSSVGQAESYWEEWQQLNDDEKGAVSDDSRFLIFIKGLARLRDVSVWVASSCREAQVHVEEAVDTVDAANAALASWPAACSYCVLTSSSSPSSSPSSSSVSRLMTPENVLAMGFEECLHDTLEALKADVCCGASSATRGIGPLKKPFCNLTLRPPDRRDGDINGRSDGHYDSPHHRCSCAAIVSAASTQLYTSLIDSELPLTKAMLYF